MRLPCKLIVTNHNNILELTLIKQLQQVEGVRVIVIDDQRPQRGLSCGIFFGTAVDRARHLAISVLVEGRGRSDQWISDAVMRNEEDKNKNDAKSAGDLEGGRERQRGERGERAGKSVQLMTVGDGFVLTGGAREGRRRRKEANLPTRRG